MISKENTKYCDRCRIRVGKPFFVEPKYKVWKFDNWKFKLCLPCFKDIKGVKSEKDFSVTDRSSGWYTKDARTRRHRVKS